MTRRIRVHQMFHRISVEGRKGQPFHLRKKKMQGVHLLLNRDVFHMIALPHFDSLDLANCRGVCKRLRDIIGKSHALMERLTLHFVSCPTIDPSPALGTKGTLSMAAAPNATLQRLYEQLMAHMHMEGAMHRKNDEGTSYLINNFYQTPNCDIKNFLASARDAIRDAKDSSIDWRLVHFPASQASKCRLLHRGLSLVLRKKRKLSTFSQFALGATRQS